MGVAVLLVGLLSTACGSAQPTQAPASGQGPTTTARPDGSQAATGTTVPADTLSPAATDQPTTTIQPSASGEPGALVIPDLNRPPDLPAPELTSVDEVVQAMAEPGMEDQAVMSMLDLLGIGVYGDDGTVILAGSDQSDADFYLFEPQARGLINLLESQNQEPWINFTDFQEGSPRSDTRNLRTSWPRPTTTPMRRHRTSQSRSSCRPRRLSRLRRRSRRWACG